MNRRDFLCYSSVAASQAALPRAFGAASRPAVAITFDDPAATDRVHLGWREVNEPYFKEGNTVAKRDGMYAFLRERGYRVGRATIDASDWAINARLESRIRKDAKADLSAYRDFFLQHIWERTQFYDSLSRRVATEPVRHTLLLHHNTLNALFFDDLLTMFRARGWHLIDAEHAYRDPIYDRQPRVLPAGESLIWALAKENGKFGADLRYPGEDDTYENPRMDALGL